ncbi:MAG: acyl-CoA dehydrogenase family protein [Hyphomicrobiales bacterium]
MDFNHTEERRMLAESLGRYLTDNYAFETRMEIVQSDIGYSSQKWQELAEMGVIGALFSEDNGGFGGAGFDITVVFEELGRAGVVEPFLATLLAGAVLSQLDNQEHTQLIESMIAGDELIALAHGEANAHYDLEHVATTANQTDDGYVLNGAKAVVLNGGEANKLIVSARLSGEPFSQDGIALFLMDAEHVGLTIRPYPTMDGSRAAEISLSNVKLPATALLSSRENSFAVLQTAYARATLAVSAEALGAMEIATQMTGEYLSTRTQFGQPIGMFQALQHRMSEMMIELQQMRSSIINAAGSLDSTPATRDKAISAAKNLTGRVGKLIAEESIQMHGGIGMTWEYAMPHFAKRIIMIDHLFGDSDHHLGRFASLSQVS